MIAKCTYTIRRALPGKGEYDYEILSAEAIQDEAQGTKTGQELLTEAMTLCRSNTAQAKVKQESK